MEEVPVVLETHDINAWFGRDQVLFNVSMQIPKKSVTAIMGPSGCGKTTFVRTLNGLHLMTPGARSSGTVLLEGVDTSPWILLMCASTSAWCSSVPILFPP